MAKPIKKNTPRAVVTPMRISRGNDDENMAPVSGVSDTDIVDADLTGRNSGIPPIPESVSLWPAVGFDVCGALGIRHQALTSAQAVIDQLINGDNLRQVPGLVHVEEFLQAISHEDHGVAFNCDCSRDYLTRITGSGNGAEPILAGLSRDISRVRAVRSRQPSHGHRCQLLEDFLHQCALMFQRAQTDELQTHSFHNIFTALAAVVSLKFWNGADCFRQTQLLQTRVVSIPTMRAYLPPGGSTERWPEPRVVAIAEVTRDPTENGDPQGTMSTCLIQLVGELLGEQQASAFGDKTVGFAIQGTKVQLAVLKMDASQRETLSTICLGTTPGILYTSPALDMCIMNERRMLLAVMAQLGLHEKM